MKNGLNSPGKPKNKNLSDIRNQNLSDNRNPLEKLSNIFSSKSINTHKFMQNKMKKEKSEKNLSMSLKDGEKFMQINENNLFLGFDFNPIHKKQIYLQSIFDKNNLNLKLTIILAFIFIEVKEVITMITKTSFELDIFSMGYIIIGIALFISLLYYNRKKNGYFLKFSIIILFSLLNLNGIFDIFFIKFYWKRDQIL